MGPLSQVNRLGGSWHMGSLYWVLCVDSALCWGSHCPCDHLLILEFSLTLDSLHTPKPVMVPEFFWCQNPVM